MTDLKDLYQEVILDHNRRPRNFRAIADADRRAEGFNPLCGDRLTLYLRTGGDTISDISFEGSGCAISRASASLMTEALKNRSFEDAHALFEKFHRMVTSSPDSRPSGDGLGKLAAFAGVCEFPARVKCASLAWHTLESALQNSHQTVSTEEED